MFKKIGGVLTECMADQRNEGLCIMWVILFNMFCYFHLKDVKAGSSINF